ncbi:hypothetical protein CHCC14814_3279 [Bacillus paralicheniformis]|nr:hypothetical protein CHCC14814_3279 [Bacillus paralicheniformis]
MTPFVSFLCIFYHHKIFLLFTQEKNDILLNKRYGLNKGLFTQKPAL